MADLGTGNRTLPADGRVGDGVNLRQPSALSLGREPLRLFAVDAVADVAVEFDLTNGNRRRIFGPADGRGAIAGSPTGAAVAVAVAEGVIYYGDFTRDVVFAVGLAGGPEQLVSGQGRGAGPRSAT